MPTALNAALSSKFRDGLLPDWIQKFRNGVEQLEALVSRIDGRVAAEVAAEAEHGEEIEEVRDREREAEDAAMAARAERDLVSVSELILFGGNIIY
jgi:hypothetical protein